MMEDKIYIAGAHSRGCTFKEYVTYLYPKTTIMSFLVNDLSENKNDIDGIPVQLIDRSTILNTNYPVYLATRSVYHDKLKRELQELGMKYIYPVDVKLDSELRNEYVRKVYGQNSRCFSCVEDRTIKQDVNVRIYVVVSANDTELKSEYVSIPYERVIQAGAAFTDKRLDGAVAFDDYGENISEKNKQYCELTALYWIWKNAQQDIVGLVHYRRHFLLPDDWVDRMLYEKIDVILPVPLYVGPNIEENYKSRHVASDWEYMMGCLKELYPDDYDDAREFFKSTLYSPCNMFIMKKEILDEFASWLFSILGAVEECVGQREDAYQNRYPGFLAERLMTFFFYKNTDKYKVSYANKNFLE